MLRVVRTAVAVLALLCPSYALATQCGTAPATSPLRGAPSQDAGTSLPINSLTYQNYVNCDVASLWDVAPLPLGSVAGTNTITASATPAIPSYKDGMSFWLNPANDTTGAVTININGKGAKAITDRNGNTLTSGALSSTARYLIVYDGTQFRVQITELELQQIPPPLPQGYISGLGLSNDAGDTDNDIAIATGVARDYGDTVNIENTASITKQTDFAWAAGDAAGGMLQSANLGGTITTSNANGNVTGSGTTFTTDFEVGDTVYTAGNRCRRITTITSDTAMVVASAFAASESGVTYQRGCKAPNTAYKVMALHKDSDGTFDVAFSTRLGTTGNPVVDLPAGYSTYRRIGYVLTDGSSINRQFTWEKDSDYFELVDPVDEVAASTVTGANSITSFAPQSTIAKLLVRAPQAGESPLITVTSANQTGLSIGQINVYTDSSNANPFNVQLPTATLDIPVSNTSRYVVTLAGGLSGGALSGVTLLGWTDKRLPP